MIQHHPSAHLLHSIHYISQVPFHYILFIRRAYGILQHTCEASSGFKYLRHYISLGLYLFHFAGSISAFHASITSANATFAQCYPMFVSFRSYYTDAFCSDLLPAHNALLHILRLHLTYLSGACYISFRCVHPFTGKAAYCLSHRPSWHCHLLCSQRSGSQSTLTIDLDTLYTLPMNAISIHP